MVTFDGSLLKIYINAILTANGPLDFNRPLNSYRTLNYVGKSNTPVDGFSASFIDDLKFYSIALSESQISMEFIMSGSYQIESISSFLTSHWPISDISLCDIVSGGYMNISSPVEFAPDRFK